MSSESTMNGLGFRVPGLPKDVNYGDVKYLSERGLSGFDMPDALVRARGLFGGPCVWFLPLVTDLSSVNQTCCRKKGLQQKTERSLNNWNRVAFFFFGGGEDIKQA